MTEVKAGLPILAFADRAAWDAWLGAQPADAPGVWLRIAKQGNPAASVGKSDAVDGALAHGWIDGQLDRYDDAWFLIRFTPRRPLSVWSAVNVKRAEALIAAGRMTPAGQAEVDAARADGRWAAAYAPASMMAVPDDFAAAFAAEPAARAFFAALDRPTATPSSTAFTMRSDPRPAPTGSPGSSRCAPSARRSIRRATADN